MSRLIRGLQQRGHAITVLVHGDNDAITGVSEPGDAIPVYSLNLRPIHSTERPLPGFLAFCFYLVPTIWRLRRFLATNRIAVTMIVIMIVKQAIMPRFIHAKRTAAVVAAAAEALHQLRTPLSAFYAIHGAWPDDIEQLRKMFPAETPHHLFSMTSDITTSGGALNAYVRRGVPGKVLTLHPAVPSRDPLGPVKWVAGKHSSAGWTVLGRDSTDVDDAFIPRSLKR